jgi:hypothetical protein
MACLLAAVSLLLLAALFMQISGVSLALNCPCRLCLLRVLLCVCRCYKLSPFQAHWGRWHCTCFLRPVCLFTTHMRSGSSPSPVEFSSYHHFYKLSCSWLLVSGPCSCPLRPGLACLFTVPGGILLPPTPPSLLCVFIVLIAYYSVSLFSTGGGPSVQGAMLIWPRVVCGSTAYHLAHLVHVFPSHLCTGIWQPMGAPGFSI